MDYMNEPVEDIDLQLLEKHAKELKRHFDTVHIFTTRHEPVASGGTCSFQSGEGSWPARYGQIRLFLIKQEEIERESVRNDESI